MSNLYRITDENCQFPNDFEKYERIFYDPCGSDSVIAEAKSVIQEFIRAIENGEVPRACLSDIASSALLVGQFAGSPDESFLLDSYLLNQKKPPSYTDVVCKLSVHLPFLESLIAKRKESSLGQKNLNSNVAASPLIEPIDCPF